MSKFIEKINTIFRLTKQKEAKGAEVWMVYWVARYGDCSCETENVAKAFLTKEDAELFAKSLHDAQKLLQNTNDIEVNIKKQK
jgi:hemolysin-activating ACP:hemolysin acyltransferase